MAQPSRIFTEFLIQLRQHTQQYPRCLFKEQEKIKTFKHRCQPLGGSLPESLLLPKGSIFKVKREAPTVKRIGEIIENYHEGGQPSFSK